MFKGTARVLLAMAAASVYSLISENKPVLGDDLLFVVEYALLTDAICFFSSSAQ
jgi:hypothetical protein